MTYDGRQSSKLDSTMNDGASDQINGMQSKMDSLVLESVNTSQMDYSSVDQMRRQEEK